MKPTIGRIVLYNVSERDMDIMKTKHLHDARGCNEQQQLPAIITAVWNDDLVNLKVILDGHGEIWATSINRKGSVDGELGSSWEWPKRV